MNLLYPEMDSPSGPSIMGSENPKFVERRNGQSDSSSTSEVNTPVDGMNTSMGGGRKSKDGLSRDERMKLVRERQMEEHRRRLDELRQAQMQAMKAKQQQEDERRRRLEEIKNRDDSRRAAVEARRKRIEDEERERCEAIIRKHQEIFDRIDSKRRRHESRKMAYGLSTYQLSDQDAVFSPGQQATSRRAISASGLSRQHGNQTSRQSHPHHQHRSRGSPGRSAQSARLRPSPSTPSRNGGGLFGDSMSGSKTTSSENSPIHSGRYPQHYRLAQSHPPPVSRNRVPAPAETATARSSKPTSRPQTAQIDTAAPPTTARAKRPSSLMTRSVGPERQTPRLERTPATPEEPASSFRAMSKRSQSVGNVSARNRTAKSESSNMKSTRSQRDVAGTPKLEEVRFEDDSQGKASESSSHVRTGRKVISEAEAKAALAEKRRQARLKVEFEQTQNAERANGEEQPAEPTDNHPPSALGVESPSSLEISPRRASEIEFLELEKSFTEESRPLIAAAPFKVVPVNGAVSLNESNPDRFSPRPEEETVGSGILRNGGGESPDVTATATDTIVVDAENAQREPEREEVIVSRDDEVVPAASPATPVIAEEPPTEVEVSSANSTTEPENPSSVSLTNPEVTPTIVHDEISPVDQIRAEAERRRLAIEQREEEERIARRKRLEAIKLLTKGTSDIAPSITNFTGSTERLAAASPVTDTAKPIDALENARKLLQRRGMNGTPSALSDSPSLMASPSLGSLKMPLAVDPIVPGKKVNGEGDVRPNVVEEARSASGTPFSETSSTDTVSLNGYIRDSEDVGGDAGGQRNGLAKALARNESISGMSDTSSVDFEPYMPKQDWHHHLNGTDGDDSDLAWKDGSSTTQMQPVQQATRPTGVNGNSGLLLNFDDH